MGGKIVGYSKIKDIQLKNVIVFGVRMTKRLNALKNPCHSILI